MKRVHVKTLSGGEILSKDLYDLNYGNILMPKGTILKKDYIDKLPMLGYLLMERKIALILVE